MSEITELTKLLEQQHQAFSEFKTANDQRLAAIEKKGYAPADLEGKVDTINAEITRLGSEMTTLAKKANRPAQPGNDNLSDEAREHKTRFQAWLRKGDEAGLRDAERKAMIVGSNPDGGFFATEEIEAGLDRVLTRDVSMMMLATVRNIGASVYKKRVKTSGASFAWVGEQEATGETTTPKYSELTFEPGTISAEPQVSAESLEDLSINPETEIAEELAIAFNEGIGNALINGDGIKKPRGLLAYDIVDNASYTWGKIGSVVTGGASGFASSTPSDALITLQHALRMGYRSNASWLMNDATLAAIRKFKDSQNQYLWVPGLADGALGLLLGKPVYVDDYMPDLASNAYPIAFGDFARAYVVVRRRGMSMLRDPFTAKPFTKFYTTMRIGGGVQNFEAVKLLKCST